MQQNVSVCTQFPPENTNKYSAKKKMFMRIYDWCKEKWNLGNSQWFSKKSKQTNPVGACIDVVNGTHFLRFGLLFMGTLWYWWIFTVRCVIHNINSTSFLSLRICFFSSSFISTFSLYLFNWLKRCNWIDKLFFFCVFVRMIERLNFSFISFEFSIDFYKTTFMLFPCHCVSVSTWVSRVSVSLS